MNYEQAGHSENMDYTEYDHGDTVHLLDYVHVVLQRLPLAIAVFVSVVVIAGLYIWTRTPRFEASSRLLVERNQIDLTDLKSAFDPLMQGISVREYLQTQVEIMRSQSVLERAMHTSELLSDPDFAAAIDPVAELAKRIDVVPLRNTQIIDVAIQREDPQQAARIVNAVVDAFREQALNRRQGVSELGLSELRKKAIELREKLDAASSDVHTFMKDNRIVSFEKTHNVGLERLRDLNDSLASVEPRRIGLQAKIEAARDALRKGQSVDTLPDILDSPVVRTMRLNLATQEQEYSQMLQRLGANHPQLQASQTLLDAARSKMLVEATAILRSMETAFEQVQNEEKMIRDALAKQEDEVIHFNQLAMQFNILAQTRDSVDSAYRTIIRRIEEIDLSRMGGGQGESIFVVSRATPPPKKAWPPRMKYLLLAGMLGGALSVGMCFFIDYMDTTVKSEHDVKRFLRTTVLGMVPNATTEGIQPGDVDLVFQKNPTSHTAEALRSLRTALVLGHHGAPLRSIVVSSTLPSEGKSLLSVNLAATQARANRRTVLVDADLRKPRLHRVFGIDNTRGLSALLQGEKGVTLDGVIHETGVEGLSFIPCGTIPANPVELLESPRMDELVARLRERFEFVIFDSPPGFALVDSIVLGKRTDGLVLVLRSFVTPKQAAQQFADRLRETGVDLLGVVLNNVDMPRSSYYSRYYKYRYGYSYHYKYRHEEHA